MHLAIIDEVMSGLGRTGNGSVQKSCIVPDMIAMAKGLTAFICRLAVDGFGQDRLKIMMMRAGRSAHLLATGLLCRGFGNAEDLRG